MELYLSSRELNGQTGHEAGRELLSELYRRATGREHPPIAVMDRGKPYFLNSDWHFSISHTKKHVFCVLSRRPVGIDAEELTRRIDLRLADKILSPIEREEFDAAEDKNRALLTFWVLKEAQGKCSGRGVGIHPNHTKFHLTDDRVFEKAGCLVAICTQEDENHDV